MGAVSSSTFSISERHCGMHWGVELSTPQKKNRRTSSSEAARARFVERQNQAGKHDTRCQLRQSRRTPNSLMP
jgi:hypothetical protein